MIFKIEDKMPVIMDSDFVAENAMVMGDVTLGERVSIWFGAVLRGDIDKIEIGDSSNIQDGCVLHTDSGYPLKVGEGVVVGHRAVLHGCTIEDNSLIGIGAIVLNGAKVGQGAIVAAGALVTEGAQIPAGHLAVGVPARVVRCVTGDEIKRINDGVLHYIDLIKHYK